VTRDEILRFIERVVNDARHASDLPPLRLDATATLLDGTLGIDSLDLAALVVELQDATDFDPFASGLINFRTVGQLADLFARRDGADHR
jgi:acyl carrier protein